MPPLISIITPVFNGIRFIECCIMNVVEQNCADAEHIIIDGGSTDGTVEVIKAYTESYEHIKWISEKDKGQSDAMNKGVEMASGAILGFLNVDDYYELGALKDALDLVSRLPDPSLLVGNCSVWHENGVLWFVSKPAMISLQNLLLGRFMEAFPMNPSAYFYHKSLHDSIGPYEIDDHFGMDVRFIIKSVQHANIKYVDKTFGNYRYLRGTKTFEADKNGMTGPRLKKIIAHYRKRQSFSYRAYLVAVECWGKLMKLRSFPYCLLRRR